MSWLLRPAKWVSVHLAQINRQPYFGGGEVYTAFLCKAFDRLGIPTTLYAHPKAKFWESLNLPDSTGIRRVAKSADVARELADASAWVISHGPMDVETRSGIGRQCLKTAVAHMPLYDRSPRSFDGHDMVFPVSQWVLSTLRDSGANVWVEPLYGVADLDRGPAAVGGALFRHSRFDWDRRKFRDRILGLIEPLRNATRPKKQFDRRGGLTLGIVSRLTPIKQFPKMFETLAPVIAGFPSANLEIFGAGGYASVRDLERALQPARDHVRFWGHQSDVRLVYSKLDYLLTGLPEKEALGLNVIEAQYCNLPVLAVNKPPFTETVLDGVTGFLFRDPREDAGADFSRVLKSALERQGDLQPAEAIDHLSKFSFEAFVSRLNPVVAWARSRLSS